MQDLLPFPALKIRTHLCPSEQLHRGLALNGGRRSAELQYFPSARSRADDDLVSDGPNTSFFNARHAAMKIGSGDGRRACWPMEKAMARRSIEMAAQGDPARQSCGVKRHAGYLGRTRRRQARCVNWHRPRWICRRIRAPLKNFLPPNRPRIRCRKRQYFGRPPPTPGLADLKWAAINAATLEELLAHNRCYKMALALINVCPVA